MNGKLSSHFVKHLNEDITARFRSSDILFVIDVDPQINFMAFLTEVMIQCEFQ